MMTLSRFLKPMGVKVVKNVYSDKILDASTEELDD